MSRVVAAPLVLVTVMCDGVVEGLTLPESSVLGVTLMVVVAPVPMSVADTVLALNALRVIVACLGPVAFGRKIGRASCRARGAIVGEAEFVQAASGPKGSSG